MSRAVSIYVYFRIDASRAAEARAAIASHLRTLAAGGLVGTASRRLPAADDEAIRASPNAPPDTWMERYDGVPEGELIAALARIEASARAHGVVALVEGGRHVEIFGAP